MSTTDPGVTELLRRASDDLAPDVEHLVRGGIARGRTRQRRARLATTLTSLAAVGIVVALTVAVPGVVGDGAREPGVATDGSGEVQEAPASVSSPADFMVPAADVPGVVARLVGLDDVSGALREAPYVVTDTDEHKLVHFRVRGMLTTFYALRSVPPYGAYEGRAYGRDGPATLDGVTAQTATVWRDGWMISVQSYNAADGKESTALSPSPALSFEQLTTVAGDDVWFG